MEKEVVLTPGQNYKNRLLKTLVNEEWKTLLQNEFEKSYFNTLCDHLAGEEPDIYPPMHHIFEPFNWVSPGDIKMVILGQGKAFPN